MEFTSKYLNSLKTIHSSIQTHSKSMNRCKSARPAKRTKSEASLFYLFIFLVSFTRNYSILQTLNRPVFISACMLTSQYSLHDQGDQLLQVIVRLGSHHFMKTNSIFIIFLKFMLILFVNGGYSRPLKQLCAFLKN